MIKLHRPLVLVGVNSYGCMYRGKPGLAAKWLANTSGSSLLVEMDNMAPEQLTAALSSMKPAAAAEMLQVCRWLTAPALPGPNNGMAVLRGTRFCVCPA